MMLLIYVDDIIISYADNNQYKYFMSRLKANFETGEEGPLDWYLGVKLIDNEESLFMCQEDYINKILEKYQINGTSETPMIENYSIIKSKEDILDESFNIKSKIGSLMYAAVCTRPDIAQAVSYVARFTNHPSEQVCRAITKIFKY